MPAKKCGPRTGADMSQRPKPQSPPEHWSKDYVEHLRAVHFGLVAVSVGLILLLTSRTYDPRAAATQLDQIMRLNELWPKGEVFRSREHTLLSGRAGVPFTSQFIATSKTLHRSVMFHIADSNLFWCFHGNFVPFAPLYLPKNLTEFSEWWDFLKFKPFALDSMVMIDPLGDLELKSDNSVLPKTLEITNQSAAQPSNVIELSFKAQRCYLPREALENPVLIPELRGDDETYRYFFRVVTIRRALITQPTIHRYEDFTPSREGETPPPEAFSFALDGQVRFGRFNTASFLETFPDIAKAADRRMDEDFARLASEVHAEVSRGDETFDAFGIKFPSEQVTDWGIIVLLAVQAYFVIYLGGLFGKLKSDDPGWDVPWMAMIRSYLARTILFISVVILPVAAAIVVLVRGWSRDVPELFLLICGALLSFVLSFLSWSFRPRLVAPPEVLEDQGSGI